jgi:hypothetical protein
MGLAPGARIGPYEVTALIGEGGMGKSAGAWPPVPRWKVSTEGGGRPQSAIEDP